MLKADMTKPQSIQENLQTWCYEKGTKFEEMNRAAVEQFINLCSPQHVLELGCGDGASYEVFAEKNISYLGVDINENKLEKIAGETITADIYSHLICCDDNSVDNIYAHHTLEHCIDAVNILQEISRVLKPGGYYYAIVPADDHLHSVHHVVFESPDELMPPGFIPITLSRQIRHEPEFICVARKPHV